MSRERSLSGMPEVIALVQQHLEFLLIVSSSDHLLREKGRSQFKNIMTELNVKHLVAIRYKGHPVSEGS